MRKPTLPKSFKRSKEDVEALIRNWEADPCWELEDTEGFEYHHDELKSHSQWKRGEWYAQRLERIALKAYELHLERNLRLAEYILDLEDKLSNMAQSIEQIKNRE